MLKNSENNKYLLSILIPAFNCVDCISFIVSNLTSQSLVDCELVIFDDSTNQEVSDFVNQLRKDDTLGCRLNYHKNMPSCGPIYNWNSLLDCAQGEYCILLHHDEFPFSDNFIRELSYELLNNDNDVFVMDCVLVDIKHMVTRQHFPNWFRKVVITYFPKYLLRRNVIGPVSTLTVKTSIFPRFDTNLQWHVDSELYFRLFNNKSSVRFIPTIKIGSSLDRSKSITSTICRDIKDIKKNEVDYLGNIYRGNFWLKRSCYNNWPYMVAYILESAAWYAFRSFQYGRFFILLFLKK